MDVLDTNDYVPRFGVLSYNRTISEASGPGTAVVKVTAQDKDQVMWTYEVVCSWDDNSLQ